MGEPTANLAAKRHTITHSGNDIIQSNASANENGAVFGRVSNILETCAASVTPAYSFQRISEFLAIDNAISVYSRFFILQPNCWFRINGFIVHNMPNCGHCAGDMPAFQSKKSLAPIDLQLLSRKQMFTIIEKINSL